LTRPVPYRMQSKMKVRLLPHIFLFTCNTRLLFAFVFIIKICLTGSLTVSFSRSETKNLNFSVLKGNFVSFSHSEIKNLNFSMFKLNFVSFSRSETKNLNFPIYKRNLVSPTILYFSFVSLKCVEVNKLKIL